jgi:hypothetical protein
MKRIISVSMERVWQQSDRAPGEVFTADPRREG